MIKLKLSHALLGIAFLVLIFISNTLLSLEDINLIFLISFIIHFIILSYLIYSFYEYNILHEKQGSKLKLANQHSKLSFGVNCEQKQIIL